MDGIKQKCSVSWDSSEPSEVVYVDPYGASANVIFVGDTILSIDNNKINDSMTLRRIMHRPTVVCVHAVDLIPSDEGDILGLSVSYDARERLQVASTRRWSLAAIHLRSGDTIKEVNGHPVASKSMLRYWMLASMEKNGFVKLLVHSDANQNNPYDHEFEMPEDVIDIAVKEIQTMRTLSSKQLQKTKTILRKDLPLPKCRTPLTICDDTVEVPIGSDWDPKKLCKVKKGQGY